MPEVTVDDGVFQLAAAGTRWLSTGVDGGYRLADAAYNVSVPSGWDHENPAAYIEGRRDRADFETPGPTLLTGVDLTHARGARLDGVVVYATVGLSNPARLPMDGGTAGAELADDSAGPGTVNLLVRTTRPLTDGALATMVATSVEAKTATLLALTDFTGTTTDAVIAGAPATGGTAVGNRERWAGSGTELGNAVRVCVRDAIQASFESRYAEIDLPDTVADADHGVVTDGSAEGFQP